MAAATHTTPKRFGLGANPLQTMPGLEQDAHALADRLPELLIDAKRIAQTVAHGIHGRRRSGPGETFWQFRTYEGSDSAQMIDWRRSASTDHLYVREREWEAAHTVWLWSDISPSMQFKSHLSQVTKRDRAVVLMLAAADLLVRGGERVGLMSFSQPTGSRKAATKLAETLVANASAPLLNKSRPPKAQLSRHSDALLFGDFLAPVEAIRERLEVLAGGGASGHIVQILDPAEETLPYDGRTEFFGPSGRERFVADRAESLREVYQERLQQHRLAVAEVAQRLGWSFMVHHTDRPASEPLLTLIMRMAGTAGGAYRWQGNADAASAGGVT
jgi:uncharacterized protein (DUF58 family)